MKRILVLMVSYFGLFSGLYAQTYDYPTAPRGQLLFIKDLERVGRPSVGYLDLRWGSSIDRLFEVYPECEEVTDEFDEARGIQRYMEEIDDGGIESRQFVFYQDKLYEVYVLYGYVDEVTALALKTKLEGIYGKTFVSAKRDVRSDNMLLKMIDWYMDFNWDLQIIFTMANVYDAHNYKLGTTMTCLYVNRDLKSEAERPKLSVIPLGEPEF